jgi:hypothetical protein
VEQKGRGEDMKVVINHCYGGFSVSEKVMERLGVDSPYLSPWGTREEVTRINPELIAIIEELGSEESSGKCANLVIVEIPFDSAEGWHIEEYDGFEWISENHRTWGN